MFIPNADAMLVNISQSIPELISLSTAIMYVIGTYIIISSVAAMRNAPILSAGGQGTPSMWDLWKQTFIGAALIYFPSTIDVGTATLFSQAIPYSYDLTQSNPLYELYKAGYLIIKLVGVIAVGKGLYELGFGSGKDSENGKIGPFSKGIMHCVAGIMCLNLQFTIEMIFSTLGIS
jgi:hypothetical protein